MTGIADLYLLLKKPHSKEAWERCAAMLDRATSTRRYDHVRFVVLSWKRTGSNFLCGIMFNHPEITMHNELFNPIDIFSYYRQTLTRNEDGDLWNPLGRDLYPEAFLEHIWTARDYSGDRLEQNSKAVGFKSFPDHFWEARNDSVFENEIMRNVNVKKVILHREDELAVYVSMRRAELTGLYMSHHYPKSLKIRVNPEAFQIFINNYRDTFNRRYSSSMRNQDTFRISYEQLVDEHHFKNNILPLLWDFLGVDSTIPMMKLKETIKQADPEEDLSTVIENFGELEFCFRHTDVKFFQGHRNSSWPSSIITASEQPTTQDSKILDHTWSILLPICSRDKYKNVGSATKNFSESNDEFHANRFHDLAMSSQYSESNDTEKNECWDRLLKFAESLRVTATADVLEKTECVVGIDLDDTVFNCQGAKDRIVAILPCTVIFIDISRNMYGRVCRIWNHLASKARNEFVVLLGDDIVLKDKGWQGIVAEKFHELSNRHNLPFGAACVALNDESFPGFPTFPVVHRWHLNNFGTLLPRQLVNQGGDPYLFELYSRFNTAAFVTTCRLQNTIGGDNEARYKKHEINWKGQILRLNLMHLDVFLGSGTSQNGICLDIVVPSYRTNNDQVLKSLLSLKCSIHAYVRFWLVVDNPDPDNLEKITALVDEVNKERFANDGNYFVSLLYYGENRGASFARNLGFNYSTADWTLFLDDDVKPSAHLLDAYLGALKRFPKAKVFVGNTEMPLATNLWTKMLRTCNIMFFYGIATHVNSPPWGVTANIMVRGSRHNSTVQFKGVYPKTGGGEDIDLCFQMKDWYKQEQNNSSIIVGVPGATAFHPWWNNGKSCYKQINGWAWGDSICISQWPSKCFWCFPNWIEFIAFIIPSYAFWSQCSILSSISAACLVCSFEHLLLTVRYYSSACRHVHGGFASRVLTAFGAGTILSFQEVTRVAAHVWRGHLYCICRRVDWNDGQDPMVKLDTQLVSFLRFVVFASMTWLCGNGATVFGGINK